MFIHVHRGFSCQSAFEADRQLKRRGSQSTSRPRRNSTFENKTPATCFFERATLGPAPPCAWTWQTSIARPPHDPKRGDKPHPFPLRGDFPPRNPNPVQTSATWHDPRAHWPTRAGNSTVLAFFRMAPENIGHGGLQQTTASSRLTALSGLAATNVDGPAAGLVRDKSTTAASPQTPKASGCRSFQRENALRPACQVQRGQLRYHRLPAAFRRPPLRPGPRNPATTEAPRNRPPAAQPFWAGKREGPKRRGPR